MNTKDFSLNNELLRLKYIDGGFISGDKKYSLIQKGVCAGQLESIENNRQRLLGGGNVFGKSGQSTEAILKFKDKSILSIRNISRKLVAQLIFPDGNIVESNSIIINGIDVNHISSCDREQIVPLLEEADCAFTRRSRWFAIGMHI